MLFFSCISKWAIFLYICCTSSSWKTWKKCKNKRQQIASLLSLLFAKSISKHSDSNKKAFFCYKIYAFEKSKKSREVPKATLMYLVTVGEKLPKMSHLNILKMAPKLLFLAWKFKVCLFKLASLAIDWCFKNETFFLIFIQCVTLVLIWFYTIHFSDAQSFTWR